MVDNSIWRTDTPDPGAWCWVTDGKSVWPAYHDGKTWTNGDTWDDTTEQRVTDWIAIYPPGTVVKPLVSPLRWEDTEVGKLFTNARGTLSGSKGAYLAYFYMYCQSTLPEWRKRQFVGLDFAFDGTVASYREIRPRICEIYGIGPQLAVVYDEIILGSAIPS